MLPSRLLAQHSPSFGAGNCFLLPWPTAREAGQRNDPLIRSPQAPALAIGSLSTQPIKNSTNPILNETHLLQALQWRYATKAFDPNRKIPAATWAALENALVLSASSFGLQPYPFIVVTDPAVRARLLPHAWNQRQVMDASHFVVFAARTASDCSKASFCPMTRW